MKKNDLTLYQELVAATRELLGPASERFSERQIQSHLQKKPEDITKDDVIELIDWIKLSLAILTEDSKTLKSFVGEIEAMVKR